MTPNVPESLKMMRLRHRETQAAEAQAVGVNRAAVRSWEYGAAEPRLSTLVKLADHYRVPLDTLIGRDVP